MPRPTALGTAWTSAPVATLNAGGRSPAVSTSAPSEAVSPGATPALALTRSARDDAATREKSQPPAAMPVSLVQPAAVRRVIRCITAAALRIIKPRRREDSYGCLQQLHHHNLKCPHGRAAAGSGGVRPVRRGPAPAPAAVGPGPATARSAAPRAGTGPAVAPASGVG